MIKKQLIRNIPTYYAVIPAEVRYCKNIPFGARLLFGEIMSLANKSGYCWASNDYFAELYDVHQTTITEWVSALKQASFINFTVGKGNIRKITVLGTIRKKPYQSKEKHLSVGKEKDLDNNTSINNNTNSVGTIVPPPFILEEEVDKLMSYSVYWLNIIGLFIRRKRLKVSSAEQLRVIIGTYSATAKKLSVFDREQVKRAFKKCEEMIDDKGNPIDWSLFTVFKVITK